MAEPSFNLIRSAQEETTFPKTPEENNSTVWGLQAAKSHPYTQREALKPGVWNSPCNHGCVPLTTAHAPISSWASPATWLMQGWSNEQTDSNDIVATHRFLKGRKISNGHASFDNFPCVGGRWKELSVQIWHVLRTLLAAYQFTSATFLFQLFLSSVLSVLTFLLFLVNRTSFGQNNKHLIRHLFLKY